ncbi:DNA polymerase III DnaE [bacterium BMS3Bbin08]|nr:DNA polymerase III DnaE [bacterium BMS3Bbin08]
MSKVSLIGTIEDFDIMEWPESDELSGFIMTNEHEDIFFTLDDDIALRYRSKLKKGKKYLFEGNLVIFESVVHPIEIRSQSSPATRAKLSELSDEEYKKNNNRFAHQHILSIYGPISSVKYRRTKSGSELAYAKFKDLPDLKVLVFLEEFNNFRKICKKNKKLFVLGSLSETGPQFLVEKIKEIN